ncbi:hypothetical protein LTR85_005120 [Meristemomyces frigidus]|nr:hypothetical protein LTR85_005120 [Meristemomyces frigidus]
MDFGAPLPNLTNVIKGANKLATAQEASQKAHEAIKNAKEGKTVEALNGSIFVTNAIFANMLKQHQDENARLTKENAGITARNAGLVVEHAGVSEQLAAKRIEADEAKELLRLKQAELEAGLGKQLAVKQTEVDKAKEQLKLKDAELRTAAKKSAEQVGYIKPRKYFEVIFHQAGYPTRCTIIYKKQTVQHTLQLYAKETGQNFEALVVISNHPKRPNELVDLSDEDQYIEPDEEGPRYGQTGFVAYEIIKVTNSAAKRKASVSASGRSGKNQKV